MNQNCMKWDGKRGHYEVWYLTLTDSNSGIGFWIRYTMVAPLQGEPTSALWFHAMDRVNTSGNVGEKVTMPIASLKAEDDPFSVSIDGSRLGDYGATGRIEQGGRSYSWDLNWQPSLPAYSHVHPLLRATKLAKTIIVLPHADLEIDGTIDIDGERVELKGAKGGQAHLWGSKHAGRWAWAHCNNFIKDGKLVKDTYFDGVSVFVPRFGRELGPNTPLLARIGGEDIHLVSPVTVIRGDSDFSLTHWAFEASGRTYKLAGRVKARQQDLVGVTYHDPDGELAYCYNTEVADMVLELYKRGSLSRRWQKVDELASGGAAHFEYAQRQPVPEVDLKIS